MRRDIATGTQDWYTSSKRGVPCILVCACRHQEMERQVIESQPLLVRTGYRTCMMVHGSAVSTLTTKSSTQLADGVCVQAHFQRTNSPFFYCCIANARVTFPSCYPRPPRRSYTLPPSHTPVEGFFSRIAIPPAPAAAAAPPSSSPATDPPVTRPNANTRAL